MQLYSLMMHIQAFVQKKKPAALDGLINTVYHMHLKEDSASVAKSGWCGLMFSTAGRREMSCARTAFAYSMNRIKDRVMSCACLMNMHVNFLLALLESIYASTAWLSFHLWFHFIQDILLTCDLC